MKSVLISIQPKWCELIASGKKTVEVRKTRPKIDVPFKCYIYCTQGDTLAYPCLNNPQFAIHRVIDSRSLYGRQMTPKEREESDYTFANGKVIGEFICDKITYLGNVSTDPWCSLIGDVHEWHKQLVTKYACLTEEELLKYGGKYAWHISDLVIYDEPKGLHHFFKPCGKCDKKCTRRCTEELTDCRAKVITRPPQSWCYVELLKGGAE